MDFDVIVRGGTVLDGDGGRERRADLGIRGDRVAAVEDLRTASASLEIDATGLAVSPGFIDTHTHSDGAWCLGPEHLELDVLEDNPPLVAVQDEAGHAVQLCPLAPDTE